MQRQQKEFNRLKRIKILVAKKFSHFGPNKKQEIERLVYEIAKRDNLNPANVLRGAQTQAKLTPSILTISPLLRSKLYLQSRSYIKAR